MKNQLEISVSTKEEAIIAEKGGADRLEVAIKSERGGLTPNLYQLRDVLINTKLPCYVLIRPKLDSYELDEEEFKLLLNIIGVVRLTTAKGISIGLLKDGKVDRDRLEKVIAVKGDLELVFNHAIDSTYNYEEEMDYLLSLDGIDWVQTTGSAETIMDGYKRLKPYIEIAREKLIVGRAIDSVNIHTLLNGGINGIVFQCKYSLVKYDGYQNPLSLDKVMEISNILKGGNNNE